MDKVKNADLVLKSLLAVLKEKKQTELLPEIAQNLQSIASDKSRGREVTVWSTLPLPKESLYQLKEVLSKKIKTDFRLVNKIDEDLIGGFRVEYRDLVFDASIKRSLERIQQILLK